MAGRGPLGRAQGLGQVVTPYVDKASCPSVMRVPGFSPGALRCAADSSRSSRPPFNPANTSPAFATPPLAAGVSLKVAVALLPAFGPPWLVL